MTEALILLGDVRQRLLEVADGTVQCCDFATLLGFA